MIKTEHLWVRFIKRYCFHPIMDSQSTLFRYPNQSEHSSTQSSSVSPLADGAKKYYKKRKNEI